MELVSREWGDRRQEERTGRIRAEVKLRAAVKQQKKEEALASHEEKSSANHHEYAMKIKAIGKVVSPYTKRMGTPRQPQLVPSSRGFIEFNIPPASLCGIDQYSHIWVIFEFHANTNIFNKKAKIRPPRGRGEKVGQLATRSPHRPNPLGLSLIHVDRWDESQRRLYISGLDLVNGTPVYDVKPCVPWDIPGYPNDSVSSVLRVPDWVDQNDRISSVLFSAKASQSLQHMVLRGRLEPLYSVKNDGYAAAKRTIEEVLAQDPRSSHKGIKENGRGSKVNEHTYSLVFGQCQIHFIVREECVEVTEAEPIDFLPEAFVDGVPLMSASPGHTN
jgi:tRNA-Thr(GGU) m(6)t(6)A37 methyltransferase TsaA